MILLELTGIKHLKNKSPQDLAFQLGSFAKQKRTKLKLIGGGTNGVALTDGTNVFKFWIKDSAYEEYINFCLKNQSNPFIPKIYSKIKSLPLDVLASKNGEKYAVKYVKMERLYELPPEHTVVKIFNDGIVDEQYNYVNSVYHLKDIMRRGYGWVSKHLGVNMPSGHLSMDDLTDDFKSLVDALKAIRKMADGNTIDLHTGNVMMRSDGQVVILDPISNDADMHFNDELLRVFKFADYWQDGYAQASTQTTVSVDELDALYNELFNQ